MVDYQALKKCYIALFFHGIDFRLIRPRERTSSTSSEKLQKAINNRDSAFFYPVKVSESNNGGKN